MPEHADVDFQQLPNALDVAREELDGIGAEFRKLRFDLTGASCVSRRRADVVRQDLQRLGRARLQREARLRWLEEELGLTPTACGAGDSETWPR
jgi:hypothetical protein